MRNVSLDLLKLISAYMIIFIHITFPGEFGKIVDSIARFGVPVFFMCSGYFCYNNDYSKIKKKIIHILKLFLIAFLLYFIYYLIESWCYSGITQVKNYIFDFFNIKRILKFILFNYTTIHGHLWFLSALIYCYILYYFLRKFNINKKAYYIISILLLIIHIFLGEILSLFGIKTNIILIRNFLFMGFPFFSIGMLMKEKVKKEFNIRTLILITIIGIIESIISFKIGGKNEMFVGSILMSISLFLLCLNKFNIKENKIMFKLINCSTLIYILHPMIGRISTIIFKSINISDNITFKYFFPIIVCIISTIISLMINYIIDKLKNKKRNIK